MSSRTLDAGALIAFERGDRAMLAMLVVARKDRSRSCRAWNCSCPLAMLRCSQNLFVIRPEVVIVSAAPS